MPVGLESVVKPVIKEKAEKIVPVKPIITQVKNYSLLTDKIGEKL